MLLIDPDVVDRDRRPGLGIFIALYQAYATWNRKFAVSV